MLCSQDLLSRPSENMQNSNISLNKVKPWIYKPNAKFSLASKSKKTYASSKWDPLETQRYVDFLAKFKNIIEEGRKNTRKWQVYRMMSKAIGSRSHEQCRSHHQKMMRSYKGIDAIIRHFRNNITSKTEIAEEHEELFLRKDELQGQKNSEEELFDVLQPSIREEIPMLREEEPLI